ncbi:GNAT family N-acetyltransferase [Sphingobacterium sp. JB170]|uniref:GNAT family N-acetyltransferase n=1 Tax=Sphingobacterium sp. JB170 TaxID=1434842 RepID=UPI00097EFC03|nr:GNAT family N-acetyltransferase [Sphingobacterium sp. JB170]SJN49130.1 Acetyltransferase (putative) [Sphingobacterium sp. JB170]
MEVVHVKKQNKWLALNDEIQIGELNYEIAEGTMTISHAEVDAHYRGHKIAEELVLSAINQARDGGLKVTPACSFAKTVFERFPEQQDLLS